jgi:hypothetical protein
MCQRRRLELKDLSRDHLSEHQPADSKPITIQRALQHVWKYGNATLCTPIIFILHIKQIKSRKTQNLTYINFGTIETNLPFHFGSMDYMIFKYGKKLKVHTFLDL